MKHRSIVIALAGLVLTWSLSYAEQASFIWHYDKTGNLLLEIDFLNQDTIAVYANPKELLDDIVQNPEILFYQDKDGLQILHWILASAYDSQIQDNETKTQIQIFLYRVIQAICNINVNPADKAPYYLPKEILAVIWPRRSCINQGKLNLWQPERFLTSNGQLPIELLSAEDKNHFINMLVRWYPIDEVHKALNLICTIEDLVSFFMGEPCHKALEAEEIPGWRKNRGNTKHLEQLKEFLQKHALKQYKHTKELVVRGVDTLLSKKKEAV